MTSENRDNEIARLKKINAALMKHVERSTDQQGTAYSLFQTAINLESQVKRRTEELTNTLQSLELTNRKLQDAKDAAETANLSKTRFLAAASHDLLQPLNAAHLLMSSLTELQQGDEARALADNVEHSLETIDELIRALLDISRLDAGVMQPGIEPIHLGELFESLESDFTPIAAERNVQLRFCKTTATVRSDRVMLRRILQNIISNAIRYTDKGKVLVGVRRVDTLRRIDILDTGTGIAEDHYADIFEEFHRGIPPGRQDSMAAGLGLGLAIVSRMLKTHGHPLHFSSVVDRGTWFGVSVPVSDQAHAPALMENRSEGVSRIQGVLGTRVLLIENDVPVLNAMEALLNRWHCDIRTARNTNDALQKLKSQNWQPDVLIADQHLDAGDLGTNTIAAVRTSMGVHTPAIIVTADPSDDLSRITEAQGIELMHKPVKPSQLRALLAHVIS